MFLLTGVATVRLNVSPMLHQVALWWRRGSLRLSTPLFLCLGIFLIDAVIITRLRSQKKATDDLRKKKKMACRQKDDTQQSLYEEQWPQKVSGLFLNIQGRIREQWSWIWLPWDKSQEFRASASFRESHASLDYIRSISMCQSRGARCIRAP